MYDFQIIKEETFEKNKTDIEMFFVFFPFFFVDLSSSSCHFGFLIDYWFSVVVVVCVFLHEIPGIFQGSVPCIPMPPSTVAATTIENLREFLAK
jgi:hypothetical protein